MQEAALYCFKRRMEARCLYLYRVCVFLVHCVYQYLKKLCLAHFYIPAGIIQCCLNNTVVLAVKLHVPQVHAQENI